VPTLDLERIMAGQQKLCKSHKHNKEDNYQMSLTVDAGTRNLDQDDADTPWATPVAGRQQQQHEILLTISTFTTRKELYLVIT
jgi:hypothetical protein